MNLCIINLLYFVMKKEKKFEEIFCAFDEKSSNETRLNAENSLES